MNPPSSAPAGRDAQDTQPRTVVALAELAAVDALLAKGRELRAGLVAELLTLGALPPPEAPEPLRLAVPPLRERLAALRVPKWRRGGNVAVDLVDQARAHQARQLHGKG